MKLLDTTHQLFTKETATEYAAQLQASDPDWKYVAKHCPNGTGRSFIEVFDEDGHPAGRI